jgi:hypothetical protein
MLYYVIMLFCAINKVISARICRLSILFMLDPRSPYVPLPDADLRSLSTEWGCSIKRSPSWISSAWQAVSAFEVS